MTQNGDSVTQRPRPQHPDSARLIYQNFTARMLKAGRGNEVYEWNLAPSDVRQSFEDAVAAHLNWLYEQIVRGLADRLRVGHYTEAQYVKAQEQNSNSEARS